MILRSLLLAAATVAATVAGAGGAGVVAVGAGLAAGAFGMVGAASAQPLLPSQPLPELPVEQTAPSPLPPPAPPPLPPLQSSPAEPAWRVMPIWGGDIRSMIVAPDDSDLVLAGTTTGQLYVSHDGGASWSNAGAALPFPGWVVSSLRWDPNQHGRLWVALWGVWGGGQVAFSDNLGRTWAARSAGLPAEPVYSLALVPAKPGHLFAGTLSGVYGSDDNGASWERLTASQPDLQKVSSLVVDPSRPDTVIAGSWRQAYRSDDGGRTWSGVFEGMVLDTEVFSLTPIPEHPGEIWASSCGWVYQTTDRGDHWTRWKDGLDERRTLSFAALADGRLLAGTVAGLYSSTDGGGHWQRISDPALSVSAIVVSPARPQRILLGTEGAGVWMSTDGGGDFFRSSTGLTATRIGGLAVVGDDLLVAVNDAGPVSGVYASRDRGKSFTSDFWPLPTVLDLASFGSHVYAGTERGLYERRGVDWHRVPELGGERVEQIVVDDSTDPARARLALRTSTGLWDLAKGTFVRRAWKHDAPRSAAFFAGDLWATDAQGVYALTADANHTVAAPAGLGGIGRIYRLGDQLVLAGPGGAWLTAAAASPATAPAPSATSGLPASASPSAKKAGPSRAPAGAAGGKVRAAQTPPAPPAPLQVEWTPLTGDGSRLLPTGDARHAALLVSGDTVRLFDSERRRFSVITVPIPPRDIAAAQVLDGRLLLATSGYGVLVRDLDH